MGESAYAGSPLCLCASHFLKHKETFMKVVPLRLARLSAVCAGLALGCQAAVHAQPTHPWFFQEVDLPMRESSVDDHLIELSKALPANCILDATGIDPQEHLKAFPSFITTFDARWRPNRLSVIYDFRGQAHLSEQALGDNGTQLFWREPETSDIVEAARLSIEGREADDTLLAEAKADDEDDPQRAGASRYKLLQEKWAKYWREAHGWDGKSTKVDISVRAADLPPDLRKLAEAEARQTVYRTVNHEVSTFSDEYWDSVRLVVDTSQNYRDSARKIPYLSYWSPLRPGRGPFRFGILDPPRQLPPAQEPMRVAPAGGEVALPNTIPPAPLTFPDTIAAKLGALELEKDPALQVPVSLEAKRRPLQVLVGDLKQQSGLALALAPDVAAAKASVTLRVSQMPLWKMMAALSRIYGLAWSKDGASYTLRPAKLSRLDLKMMRLGEGFRLYQNFLAIYERHEREKDALAREIAKSVNRGLLNSPQGVPLQDVPEELRNRLRQSVEEEGALEILEKQGELDYTPLEGMVVRFGSLTSYAGKALWGASPFVGKEARMRAFTADGRFIGLLFERFRARAPEEPWYAFPPLPPGWKAGDPIPPIPEGWKPGDPVATYPPGWKKGDPWPQWPKPQGATPQGATPQAAPQGAPPQGQAQATAPGGS